MTSFNISTVTAVYDGMYTSSGNIAISKTAIIVKIQYVAADLAAKDEDFISAAGSGMTNARGGGGGPPDDRGHPLHAVCVQDRHAIQNVLASLPSEALMNHVQTMQHVTQQR